MDQIKRAGWQLKWIVMSLLILTPVVYIGVFLWKGPDALLQVPGTVTINLENANAWDNLVMFLLPVLTPLIYWWAFYFLYDLANQYASGMVFTPSAVKTIRNIGILFIVSRFCSYVSNDDHRPITHRRGAD